MTKFYKGNRVLNRLLKQEMNRIKVGTIVDIFYLHDRALIYDESKDYFPAAFYGYLVRWDDTEKVSIWGYGELEHLVDNSTLL